MRKKYNTPHRRHVVKTRLSDEEHDDFMERLAAYQISHEGFQVLVANIFAGVSELVNDAVLNLRFGILLIL